jgi:hypothetical protein
VTAKKKPLTKVGQVGLVMLVIGMVLCVGAGSLMALLGLLCGIGGFYTLTHQETLKLPFLKEEKSRRKTA